MKKKVLSLSLIIIALCSIFTFSFMPKSEATLLVGYGWKKLPIKIYASSELNANERAQVQEAINSWNSTKFGTLFQYGGVRSASIIPLYTMADGYNTISKLPLENNVTGRYLSYWN